MTHLITAATVTAFEEQCTHEFFDLARDNTHVETLCDVIACLVERLGGLGQVPDDYRYTAARAIEAIDVLAVREIQWFPDADIGSRT
jgi:hypothetical protein